MSLLTILHVITCVLLILVVLIQAGKGADISASLGGSSQTVFGSSGGANFFTRFTGAAAGIFMLTSLGLTLLSNHENRTSVMEGVAVPAAAPSTTPSAAASPVPAASAAATPAATTQKK